MRICASYHINPKFWNNLDEIRFSVGASIAALEYAASHPDKKVIIETLHADEDDLTPELVNSLLEENENLYFDFYEIDDLIKYANGLRKYMYHYPVSTFNMLYFLLQYPLSDITISEPMTFDLDTLKITLDHLDPEERPCIRVNPAIGRPTLFNNIADIDDGLKHFWLLPQHMEIYDPYIDVVDLLDNNHVREETLVQIFRNKRYNNELRYYLLNGENTTEGVLIDDAFAKRRINCRQVCMRGKTSFRCNYCWAETELYRKLKEQSKTSEE